MRVVNQLGLFISIRSSQQHFMIIEEFSRNFLWLLLIFVVVVKLLKSTILATQTWLQVNTIPWDFHYSYKKGKYLWAKKEVNSKRVLVNPIGNNSQHSNMLNFIFTFCQKSLIFFVFCFSNYVTCPLANFTICLLFKTFVASSKLVYTKLEICFSVFCFISDMKILDSMNYQSKSMSCSNEPLAMRFFCTSQIVYFLSLHIFLHQQAVAMKHKDHL